MDGLDRQYVFTCAAVRTTLSTLPTYDLIGPHSLGVSCALQPRRRKKKTYFVSVRTKVY